MSDFAFWTGVFGVSVLGLMMLGGAVCLIAILIHLDEGTLRTIADRKNEDRSEPASHPNSTDEGAET